VLHFSLLRFVFDAKTYERRKSRASIKFPRGMDLGGHHYRLQAIITHSGPNAHQGHFVCETLDENTDTWYMCNDEEVTTIKRDNIIRSERQWNDYFEPVPKKARTRLDANDLSSKDAYMLVYTRMDPSIVTSPPHDVMQLIKAEQAGFEADQMEREAQKERLKDEYDGLVGAKKQVAKYLPGSDRIIPTSELERWFAAENMGGLFSRWTIPLCAHGEVDPDSTALFKLVSADAFELLQTYGKRKRIIRISTSGRSSGASSELPESRPLAAGSSASVTSKLKNGVKEADGINSKLLTADSHQAENGDSAALSSGRTGCSTASSSRLVSANDTDENRPANNNRNSSSPSGPTTFDLLPQLSICPTCVEEEYRYKTIPEITEEDQDFWKAEVKHDRPIAKMMDDKYPVYGADYYYLPDSFVDKWLDFVKSSKAPRPELPSNLGRCGHDLLDIDLEMDAVHYISEKGWGLLIEK
jgi:ubiquitin carboxyl-terminal hydrolase 48